MTTKKKAGAPRRVSKKLNLKKKTLKDLEPSRGKDAKGGYGYPVPPPPPTYTCRLQCAKTANTCVQACGGGLK